MTQSRDGAVNDGTPSSEEEIGVSEEAQSDEPRNGETTERQPAWRPGGKAAGEGIYGGGQATSTGTDEEPEGPGI